MKIFLITEGGNNIGLGHITRCIAIYQSFEERGVYPCFIINADDSVLNLLGKKNFEFFNWVKEQEKLITKIKDCDIAIIDSYLASKDLYEKIADNVKKCVYIDDNNRLEYPKGIVLNGAIYANELSYPKKNGVKYLLGLEYFPLRKEFWNVPAKIIKEHIEDILITFGGEDLKNLTPRVLFILRREFPEIKKHVVIGKSFKNIEQIEKLKDDKTYLYYNLDTEGMKNSMLKADVAISAGGQTLYELAKTGTPTVALAVAENQIRNVKGWVKLKKGIYLCLNIKEIKKLILKLEDYKIRKRASIGLIDVKSNIFNIADYCSFFEELIIKKAEENDSRNVYLLSNDPFIRENSLNCSKIKWEEHNKWFTNKITDVNYLFYVVYMNSGDFVGQVRYEIKSDNYAIVSISLMDKFRGKDIGEYLLKTTADIVFKDTDKIIAYIKKDNKGSMKCFKKAGYKLLKEKFVKKVLCEEYIYERNL